MENDSLATIFDKRLIGTNEEQTRFLIPVDSRIGRQKGGPHAVWNRIIPNTPNTTKRQDEIIEQEEPIIFSDPKSNNDPIGQILLSTHEAPLFKECALNQIHRKPGYVPISNIFHRESSRPRNDDTDDEDLDCFINIKKKKVDSATTRRGKSIVYDSIYWVKGEFNFPYRTYRPKVQVPTKVPPGATPQAIVMDRLHRIYRRVDINAVLTGLGVEYADLLPPPNYGEQNPRFYQETMWRNRCRISGVEKRSFIYENIENSDYDIFDKEGEEKSSRTRTNSRSSGSGSSYTSSNQNAENPDEDGVIDDKTLFIQRKIAFGAQFPLEFFDNEDYDIRSAEDWMNLRYDAQGNKYPLPGKAYLPMPLENVGSDLVSLSQLTSEALLNKSNHLQNFRNWLLMQRYRRMVLGDSTRVVSSHRSVSIAVPSTMSSDTGMSSMIHTGTTVRTMIKKPSTTLRTLSKRGISTSEFETTPSLLKIYTGELGGESDLDTASMVSLDDISDDFLSQFSGAGLKEITPSEEPIHLLTKRSESILPDVWSDPNSLEYLLNLNKEIKNLEITEPEVPWSSRRQELTFLNESLRTVGTKAIPKDLGSPDIDPYAEGNFMDLIYEYSKMKKVHNYDWKWVEVAVFEYNGVKQLYLVRSINKPFIFAWVPKIYLCMDGEDPNVHSERIKDAIERRNYFETVMRYNLYVDCLPIDTAMNISESMMENIEEKTITTSGLIVNNKELQLVKKETNLDYMRAHMKMLFVRITEAHLRQYKTWIHDEDYYQKFYEPGINWQIFTQRMKECKTAIFQFKCYRLLQSSVIYKVEPWGAISDVIDICLLARQKPYILTREEKPIPLEAYLLKQLEQMKEIREYLQNVWSHSIVETIKNQLGKIPRSWYNIDEEEWDVFEVSKSSKFLNLVKFMMQDTLRFMVLESVTSYIDEIRELSKSCSQLDKKYIWQNDLKTTEFPTPLGMAPIWVLELTFSNYGPMYTQFLREFPSALTELIKLCVDSSSGIPDIIPQIMTNLLFGTKKNLISIEKKEKEIGKFVVELELLLRKALIPVDAYAQVFKYYLPVWNLDVEKFMTEWNSVEHNTKEIKATVEFHIRHYAEIESEIPTTIDIGAFRINVEPLKIALLKRKKSLYTSILDSFATKLRKIVLESREEYEDIEKKLTNRTDDIEEVMELKHYLAGVHGVITRKDELIQKALKDYDLFDKFKYSISNEDFEAKWSAALSSKKVYKVAEDAVGWLDDDYERLLRVQQQDLSELSDAVDLASMSVAGLTAYVELEKASEVKQEVQKVWKIVNDLQEHITLLNKRQIIFGLPPAQNEALERIAKDIQPYKSLWFTCADWLKVQDVIYNQTLDKLDMTVVNRMITNGLKIIKKCIKVFTGADTIQHIAKEVRHQIEELKPLVPLIKTFKNPGLRQRHLEAISVICGFTVVAKGNQSFRKLMEQGIGGYVDEIAQIGENAANELHIENGLDKMQKGINTYRITIEKDEYTGLTMLITPKGVESVMKAFIKVTEDFMLSPYREPFDEKLDSWDKKLREAFATIKLIKEVQAEWFTIQTSFVETEDAENEYPDEFKLFTKMQRIWRRIIRIAKLSPEVLDCGSDTTMRVSLVQLQNLVVKLRKFLEEQMEDSSSDSGSDDDNPTTAKMTNKK